MADIVYPGKIAGGPLNSGSLPGNYDMQIYKGDFVEIQVVLKDEALMPINLTGTTAKAVIKVDYDSPVLQEFECSTTNVAGQVIIFLSSIKSSQLEPGSYIWDFQVEFSEDRVKTYLTGDIVVFNEVTRSAD